LKNLLAVDLGASSGRVITGQFDGTKLKTKTVHRFRNGGVKVHENMYWDILDIFNQIIAGTKKASNYGDEVTSIGVDSWGVDYAYLDKNGNLLSNPHHYRDSRTNGLYEEIYEKISREEIYQETGIQFMPINTLVQFWADKKYRPWIFELAEDFLMIPDLINYFLTGEKFNEYTNASTTQLFNVKKLTWSQKIFQSLNFRESLTKEIIFPGVLIGNLTEEISSELNLSQKPISVYSVGSHDTASAVAAIPFEKEKDSAFISNGTWSLLGMELDKPLINEKAFKENFTNECGVNKKIRFLKNIIGLWLIEECKRKWEEKGENLSYQQIVNEASNAEEHKFRINPNDDRFINPDNMVEEIKNFCRETGQDIPKDFGELARGIYESLAKNYSDNIDKLEDITGNEIEIIHMVGGGTRADILCELTAKYSKRKVLVGPVEATALGNIIVQLIAQNELEDLNEGRDLIRDSVEFKIFE